jgi:hypothetical protein
LSLSAATKAAMAAAVYSTDMIASNVFSGINKPLRSP